jgi:hypothetical protein
MDAFDYSQYSINELQDAQRHIDRSMFPDRATDIDRWIAIRSSALHNSDDSQELPQPQEIEASKRDGRILAAIDLLCALAFAALYRCSGSVSRVLWMSMLLGQLMCVGLLLRGGMRYRVRLLRKVGVRSAQARVLQWPFSVLALYALLYGLAIMVYGKS